MSIYLAPTKSLVGVYDGVRKIEFRGRSLRTGSQFVCVKMKCFSVFIKYHSDVFFPKIENSLIFYDVSACCSLIVILTSHPSLFQSTRLWGALHFKGFTCKTVCRENDSCPKKTANFCISTKFIMRLQKCQQQIANLNLTFTFNYHS